MHAKMNTLCKSIRSKHVIISYAYAYIEKPRPGTFYPEKAKAQNVPKGPLWSKLQQGIEIRLANGKVVRPEDVMGSSRQGRKIVYTGDTSPFKLLEKFAFGADVLIHDSTLGDELVKRAQEYGHSTVDQAAKTAKNAMVKKLVLSHISQRYKDMTKWVKQAQKNIQEHSHCRRFYENRSSITGVGSSDFPRFHPDAQPTPQ